MLRETQGGAWWILQNTIAVWNGLLDLVYPPVCLICGAIPGEPFCNVCRLAIQPIQPPYCDRCGIPVMAGSLVCSDCLNGPEPPFAWSQALGGYGSTLKTAIHRLKYDGKTALARPLGELLARSLGRPGPLSGASAEPSFDLVVPVPLHSSKRRQRGFNQAELVGKVLASEWGWALDTRGLLRVQKTRTQTSLGVKERADNVRGAFAAREPHYFAERSVLIVDDVLTSLATTRECARVVRDAGASRVCIVAIAQGV